MIVTGTSYNITGLQPFTNYMVTVRASNTPTVEFGPPQSAVFATLPEATIPPEDEAPSVDVPQVGDGSSGIVEIMIPSPAFQSDRFLRYTVHLCVHYRVALTVCATSVCTHV